MSDIEVRLPDGKTLSMPAGSNVLNVAERIGPGLARAALAGLVDGRLVDLRAPLTAAASIQIVTAKSPEAGEVIRHSAEHVMADAVRRLFPGTQIDVGRSDHSEKFQYDFLVERPFTPDDLEAIAAEMARIIAEDAAFERIEVTRDEARSLLEGEGEELKLSRLDDIPEGDQITIFRHGKFNDLCRGPHVQHAKQIGAFHLIEAAGSYWRGDERNPMLQRIYGTAFASRKDLEAHLAAIEDAKERDHRKLGAELELFMIDPLSPGSPFYLPKGMVLYNTLIDFIRSLYPRYGYQEVMTPQIFRTDLYKTSGHYELFREDMFIMQGDEDEELGVKPMNCPGHCVLFGVKKRSYRELPLRFAEFSRLHRNERSGTLTGLSRVRSMAQDDAHIYCEEAQVETELASFFAMTEEVYQALGLEGVEVGVSTRPEGAHTGEPADWDVAEQRLIEAVRNAGYDCSIKPGDAAFYGPKVECDFRDVLGRAWTLSTLQIDVSMPTRFGLQYVGRDGEMHRPAMLHRAILGSLERFISLYTEMCAGDFPFWLAPVQVRVLPITDRHLDYCREVEARLRKAGIRVHLDDRNEKLGFKIREAEVQKIPLMLVAGDNEAGSGTVTPRWREEARESGTAVALDTLVAALEMENETRRAERVS